MTRRIFLWCIQLASVFNVEAVKANNKDYESAHYYEPVQVKKAVQRELDDFLNQATIKLIGKLKDKLDLFNADGKNTLIVRLRMLAVAHLS